MIRTKLISALITLSLLVLPVYADTVSKITVKELIVKHAKEMGVDPALALSIAKTESGFKHETKSRYGAVGVFQLMPKTATKLGYNPYKVSDNIKGGITYYQMMYKMFGTMELALAAYNAGPGNVKKYNGIPPFSETKRFVTTIMQDYNYFKKNPDPAMLQKEETIAAVNSDDIIANEEQTSSVEAQPTQEETEEEFRREQQSVIKTLLEQQAI